MLKTAGMSAVNGPLKNVRKGAGGKRYLPLLFHLFIPRIARVATAATSVGVVTPGVEIAGAPSVVSRVSPLLLLCSSAPTLLLLLGLWRSVRCSPQWWQHPVKSGGTALRKVKIVFFTFSFLTLLIRENIPGSCQKTFLKDVHKKSFLILTISWKKWRMLLKEMKHLSDFNLQRSNLHNCF